MTVISRAISALAALAMLGACATSQAPSQPSAASASVPSPAASTASAAASSPETTAASSAVVSQSPSASGPTVVESGVYPYRITVATGPVTFVPTRVAWDGEQKIRRDSRAVDLVRLSGGPAMWLVMTDTSLDAEAYAADIAEKQRTWNGCAESTGRQPFQAGGRAGVAFIQSCGAGAEVFARAVVVGDGQALFAFSDGRSGAAAVAALISFLQAIEFTESAQS